MKHVHSEQQIKSLKDVLNVEVDGVVEGNYADVIYLKNATLYLQFIEPHEGTSWNFCLRADFPETFDRWSVCLFEEEYQYDDFEKVLNGLKDFYKNKDSIVAEELNG